MLQFVLVILATWIGLNVLALLIIGALATDV